MDEILPNIRITLDGNKEDWKLFIAALEGRIDPIETSDMQLKILSGLATMLRNKLNLPQMETTNG